MSETPSVGFVCQEYPPRRHGGVGAFVRNLGMTLSEMGARVVVFEAEWGGQSVRLRQDSKITVVTIPTPSQSGLIGQYHSRWHFGLQVSKMAAKYGCDYLEVNESGGWGAFIKGVPVLIRLHNSRVKEVPIRSRGRGTWLLENLALKRANKLTGVSEYIAHLARSYYRLSGIKSRGIEIIYNGIRCDDFPIISYDKRNQNELTFVGTLKPVKGLDRLIKAMKILEGRFPDVRLEVYGRDSQLDGVEYSKILKRTILAGDDVWSKIEFRGPVDHSEVGKVLGAGWVCVVPSAFEAMVTVALEAMATGMAVVAGPFESVREIVENGKTGMTVSTMDPAELADGIMRFLEAPSLAQRVGADAAEVVRREFSVERTATATLKLMEVNSRCR